MVKQFAFSKRVRLIKNEEFKAVIGQKKRYSDGVLTIYLATNGRDYARLGVSIGKAAGNSPLRNRIKRIAREVFRRNPDSIPSGFDYVVLAGKRVSIKLDYETLKASFLKLAANARN